METDQNNKDCIGCRIVSGSGMILGLLYLSSTTAKNPFFFFIGMIGIGVYVASQSKNSINKLGKLFIQTISLGETHI